MRLAGRERARPGEAEAAEFLLDHALALRRREIGRQGADEAVDQRLDQVARRAVHRR